MRRHPVRQIEHDLVRITPPPALGRIVTFDNGMFGAMEMFGGMLVLGLIAAADMTADAAEAQMKPCIAQLQTFLAAQRTGLYVLDRIQM